MRLTSHGNNGVVVVGKLGNRLLLRIHLSAFGKGKDGL